MTPEAAPAPTACPGCGTELGTGLLACPRCHRLVHAEELTRLAARAQAEEGAGDLATALATWRSALALLPPGTRQHEQLRARVAELAERAPRPRGRPGGAGRWWSLAGIGALLVAILSKGKFLLLGLTKLPTLLSMLAFFGASWTAWGWPFALGIVASLYVHEMGHVAEMKRRGMPMSAPLFIPGLGALVRLGQHPASAVEDARIGLAGPAWGLGAALAALAGYFVTGRSMLGAIATTGAWINLFNLLPVWQLDGSRGFASLTRAQRFLVAAGFAVAWGLTRDGLLAVLAVVAVARAAFSRPSDSPDWMGLVQFLGLIATLAAVAAIPVALPT